MKRERHKARVQVKLLYENSKMPENTSEENSGYDLFAHKVEDCGTFIKVYSGIAIAPESTHYFLLAPRSSVYKKGLIMHNSIGVIDTNYRGEIIGIFHKTSNYQEVLPGERVMQLIAQELIPCEFQEVEALGETERGSGGFGSSGT
jgi:dUTP pyrophosphatase